MLPTTIPCPVNPWRQAVGAFTLETFHPMLLGASCVGAADVGPEGQHGHQRDGGSAKSHLGPFSVSSRILPRQLALGSASDGTRILAPITCPRERQPSGPTPIRDHEILTEKRVELF